MCDLTPFTGNQVACAIQDIKLWNLDNNTVIAGPMELTAADDNQSQLLAFTDDYTVNAGSTTHLGLSVDVRNTPSGNMILLASMSDGTNSFTANDIKNVGSNTYLTLGTDIVPSTPIAGKSQTVTIAGLTVSTAPSPTDATTIKGGSNYTAAAFNLSAGSGSAVKITSLAIRAGIGNVVTLYGAAGAAAGGSATVADVVLSVKLMDGATQVGNTKTFVSGVATFDSLNWTIPSSETKKLDVVITTNSAATLGGGSDFMRFVTDLDNDISAVDTEGNSLAETAIVDSPATTNEIVGDTDDDDSLTSGQAADIVLTISDAGSLTASLAPTPTNPSSSLIASGSTDKVIAAFKLEATNESFNVKKFDLVPLVGGSELADSNDRIATLKVRYPSQSSGSQTRTVGLSGVSNVVDITTMPMYVPQNGSATLEVLADFATFSNLNGTESENIAFQLDANDTTNNQATGISSGTDDNNWGSELNGNRHDVVRTVLTAAAGSGTPNSTARTRAAAQKVFSTNLSASSVSNAFLRGSRKAPDSAITGWAATDADSLAATIATAGNFVSGASAITSVSAATTASVLAHNFGATPGLDTYQRVSAWVRLVNSSGAGAAVTFDIDDTALLASPEGSVAVGTSSTTATWYYVDVTTASLGVTATTQYVGLTAAAPGAGTQTMIIDDLRFYRDSMTMDVAGNLGTAVTVQGLLFSMKDTGGTTRMYGAYNGTATVGTVVLIPGNGADVAVITNYSDVEVSSSALALDVETNTSTLMAVEGTEVTSSLSVSVDTGNVSSAGDFRWYDNSDTAGSNDVAAQTAVNPLSTTITFANTY